jgi:hypothetical protein
MVVQVEIFQAKPRGKHPKLYQNEAFSTMTTQTIQFGDEGQAASREMLRRYDAHVAAGQPGVDAGAAADLRRELATLESLDHQYGGSAPIALEGAGELVDSILPRLAALGDPELVIAAALWAMRHRVEIGAVEPVVNALAQRSNRAAGRRELAAVAGLMLGLAEHVRDRLGADLERSNPERPWRVLHANLAITAIRSEDPALIDAAFDALDAALPDERGAFYAEALALALAPGIAPEVRSRIEARHRRWAAR